MKNATGISFLREQVFKLFISISLNSLLIEIFVHQFDEFLLENTLNLNRNDEIVLVWFLHLPFHPFPYGHLKQKGDQHLNSSRSKLKRFLHWNNEYQLYFSSKGLVRTNILMVVHLLQNYVEKNFFFFFWKNICFLQNIHYLQKKMFLYGKKILYGKIFLLKKTFFTEKNIYENIKNIYLIWEIFFYTENVYVTNKI